MLCRASQEGWVIVKGFEKHEPMKLEPIIQSEVRQKEKHQFSIITHTYGIEKNGNDNPVCETAKCETAKDT